MEAEELSLDFDCCLYRTLGILGKTWE